MEKRILIAVVLSIGFLWLWAAVAPKLFPELAKKPAATATSTADTKKAPVAPVSNPPTGTSGSTATTGTTTPSATAVAIVPAQPVAAESIRQSVIETSAYRAVFSNRGAQLVSFQIKGYERKEKGQDVDLVRARGADRTDYPFAIESADRALAAKLNNALYAVTEREERGGRLLEFRFSDGATSVVKTFRFDDDPFLFDFSVSVNPPVPYRVAIGPGIESIDPHVQDSRMVMTGSGIVHRDGKFKVINREKGDRVQVFESLRYIGIEDNYFMTVMRPAQGAEGVLHRVGFVDAKKNRREEFYAAVNATPQGTVAGDAFFGPKETKLLDRYDMGDALQFGWFGAIARFFLKALVWLNQYTKNYGFAIIVLTILIKMVLYPLQHKSIVSMKKMQKVQPKTEAIKAKYKKSKTDPDQRQKMNVEMMQLYQKEGINPMAGCLPLILQLPILWGFYNLLSRAIELRGAPFMLWIQDLSEKDPYYITPILMTATMFIQTYITPSTGDPAQRKIFLIMPLVFGFMFKDFPSGLVLYWLVQNVLTIAQQLIMNKWWKDHPEEIAKA